MPKSYSPGVAQSSDLGDIGDRVPFSDAGGQELVGGSHPHRTLG
jgi:hypothetical protein